jgi:hypothetical protein
MHQLNPIAGQVTRVVGGVWICGDRSGGGFGTKSGAEIVRCGFCVSVLGITYLDLFLAERDAIHNTCTGRLVWFSVPLIFGLEYCVILGAVKWVPSSQSTRS